MSTLNCENVKAPQAVSELENVISSVNKGSERIYQIYERISAMLDKLHGAVPEVKTAEDVACSENIMGKLHQSTDRLHNQINNLDEELKRFDGII